MDDDYELKKRSNILSRNEMNCIMKNRILNKYLNDRMTEINKENKFSSLYLRETTKLVENSYRQINTSTGRTYFSDDKRGKNGNSKSSINDSNDKRIENSDSIISGNRNRLFFVISFIELKENLCS